MVQDKKPLSGRVPADTYRRVEELIEERGIRKSDFIRRAVEHYVEVLEQEEDQSCTADDKRSGLFSVLRAGQTTAHTKTDIRFKIHLLLTLLAAFLGALGGGVL